MASTEQQDHTPEILQGFVEVQKRKMDNEGRELALREKEVSSNERLAMRSMELQAQLLRERPREARRNITRLAYVVGVSVVVVFLFLAWLLYTGNGTFAVTVLEKGSYVVVALAGYFAGRKNGRHERHRDDGQGSDGL